MVIAIKMKKNADRWRSATYEEVLRGINLENLDLNTTSSYEISNT